VIRRPVLVALVDGEVDATRAIRELTREVAELRKLLGLLEDVELAGRAVVASQRNVDADSPRAEAVRALAVALDALDAPRDAA
jgi:hypothetical protein